jgi:hypothetical protein
MRIKLWIFLLPFSLTFLAEAQISNTWNKLKSNVFGEETETQDQNLTECNCEDAVTVFRFSGNLQFNYLETDICLEEDGSALLTDRNTYQYYISRNGKVTGPYEEFDPEVTRFRCLGIMDYHSYPEYISKKEGKWIITFEGKQYGPYAEINEFLVSLSKKKFVAIVIRDNYMAGIDMEELEEKMKNATQEEQMKMAMELSEKMQNQMELEGEMDLMPRFVTNVEGVDYDPMAGSLFYANMKYDDICFVEYNKITGLKGNTLLEMDEDFYIGGENFWINKDNSRYAWFDYGTLYFSDGKKCDHVFSPSLVMEGNTEYIRYMFYSPDEDAVKMCRILF